MRGSLFQTTTFIELIPIQAEKTKRPLQSKKASPHNHADLPPLISVEAKGVCMPICNNEVLLAAVYKSLGRAWSDADIIELLSFRRKSILGDDLNAKQPFWNSAISNPSGKELLHLFDIKQFEISTPQCPTHYSAAGNGDVLDTVAHQNISVRCHRF
jgi:hypothetical protein